MMMRRKERERGGSHKKTPRRIMRICVNVTEEQETQMGQSIGQLGSKIRFEFMLEKNDYGFDDDCVRLLLRNNGERFPLMVTGSM